MSKKFAFLFPGQGAQFPGMIKDVVQKFESAKKIINDICEIVNFDVKKLLWDSDVETLSRSDNSQIAITAVSLAVAAVLCEKGIKPTAAMGFSLGEFPALWAAGVLSFENVVKVVRERGLIMQRVCDEIVAKNAGSAPGMTAVLGLAPEKVKEIADSVPNAYAANMNSIKQTVVSGTFDALAQVEKLAVQAGARRAVRLKVAGPFHCPLMKDAATEFEKVLVGIPFEDPKIHLFSNVTGEKVKKGEDAKINAVLHLTNPVLWTNEETVLAKIIEEDGGFENWSILEVGPGKVLTGLWGQTKSGSLLEAIPVSTTEEIEKIII